MRRLAARALLLSTLAFCACSDRSAPRDDVGSASMQIHPTIPRLGPAADGWRLPSTGDFNADGMADVIWRNLAQNTWTVWLMRGTSVLEQGPVLPGPRGSAWTLVEGADFNLDGIADLLWNDLTANVITVWLMRGMAPLEQGPVIPGPAGDGWLCSPARDFNGDGIADVLWSNPTENLFTVWLMRGTEPFEQGPEIPGPGVGWFASFGADFDRDGLADILWYNPEADRMVVWLMRGTGVRARGAELPTPPSSSFILAAAGDFNRDRMPDELWYDTARRRMTATQMFGAGLLSQGPEVAGPPGSGWIVGNVADCDGNGLSDVLWLNASPLRMSVWLMSGPVPIAYGPDIAGPPDGP